MTPLRAPGGQARIKDQARRIRIVFSGRVLGTVQPIQTRAKGVPDRVRNEVDRRRPTDDGRTTRIYYASSLAPLGLVLSRTRHLISIGQESDSDWAISVQPARSHAAGQASTSTGTGTSSNRARLPSPERTSAPRPTRHPSMATSACALFAISSGEEKERGGSVTRYNRFDATRVARLGPSSSLGYLDPVRCRRPSTAYATRQDRSVLIYTSGPAPALPAASARSRSNRQSPAHHPRPTCPPLVRQQPPLFTTTSKACTHARTHARAQPQPTSAPTSHFPQSGRSLVPPWPAGGAPRPPRPICQVTARTANLITSTHSPTGRGNCRPSRPAR